MLGEAIARKFYTAGCKIILVGPNETELERVRVHLVSLRPKDVPVYQPECLTLDLTDTSEVPTKTAGILEQCGQVDILVNNASICTRSDVMSSALDTDIRVMNINYFGPIAFTKGMRAPHSRMETEMYFRMLLRSIFISGFSCVCDFVFRISPAIKP